MYGSPQTPVDLLTVSFAQTVAAVDFQDNSARAVTGRISFAPAVAVPGVEQCGVEGIVVSAFSLLDTGLQDPLYSSAPTGPDGVYTVAVLRGEAVRLVPSFYGNLSVHSFSPSSSVVTLGSRALAGVDFSDTTQQTLTLQLLGGLCQSPVGSVVPVLVLESCGGLHFPLPAFSFFPEQYVLPPVVGSLLGYTADAADGSGLQLPAGDTSSDDLQYRDTINAWLVSNVAIAVNLSLSGLSEQLVYYAPANIAQLTPSLAALPCVQDGAAFDIAASGSTYTFVWQLSESYGLPSGTVLPCSQLEPAVQLFVFDGLSDDLGNECVLLGCVLQPSYDPVSGTTVSYTTVLGAPYLFTREPSAPDYTRSLQYGIANSLNPQQYADYVLVTGSVAYQGVASVAVPVQNMDPLYILRRPPGGSSYASYEGAFTVTASSSVSQTFTSTTDANGEITAALLYDDTSCRFEPWGGAHPRDGAGRLLRRVQGVQRITARGGHRVRAGAGREQRAAQHH